MGSGIVLEPTIKAPETTLTDVPLIVAPGPPALRVEPPTATMLLGPTVYVWPLVVINVEEIGPLPTIIEFEAGVANAKVEEPTTRPDAPSEILLPRLSVIAGPETERVVPDIATAVLPSGVKVWPFAVRGLLSLTFGFELARWLGFVARGIVELPITIEKPEGARLMGVPDTVIAAEPGEAVWPFTTYPLPLGRAVRT